MFGGICGEEEEKKSKFKGETVFGWLNVTGCSSAAELIMCGVCLIKFLLFGPRSEKKTEIAATRERF